MKAVIFLGGEFYNGVPRIDDRIIISCDIAYSYIITKGIKPDIILGDFDSLGYIPEGAIVYPKEKDKTDFELAIDYSIEKNITDIVVYCGGGGRDDHFISNISVAFKAYKRGINIKFITNYSIFFPSSGDILLPNCNGKTLSVIPLCNDIIIKKSIGLKYSCSNLIIPFASSRGVSNEIKSDNAFIQIEGDALIFLINNELR